MTPGPAPAWKLLAGAVGAVGFLVYAVVAYRAAAVPEPGLFEASVFIVPLMIFALMLAWRAPGRAGWLALWLAACAALFLLRGRLAASTSWVLLLQHVGINALLGLAFARSLLPGATPLVSRMARIVHGGLSSRLERYTRTVTVAWVVYFGVTAAVSLALFAFAPPAVWSAFVNLLSLPLLLAMFVGEYAVRCLCVPPAERSGLLQSYHAWREYSRRGAESR